MPAGKTFNLTEERIKSLKKYLGMQYSVRYVADRWNIDETTLSSKIQEAGLDAKKMKREGINTFKADTFAKVLEIDDPKDQVKARMDLLKHYDTSDDVASNKQEVETTSTQTIINVVEDTRGN